MRSAQLRTSIRRWKTARNVALGAVILAGSVVTSAAVMYRMAMTDCGAQHQVQQRAYTYSGVGVVIEREGEHIVVSRVIPGAPSEGVLFAGARLVSVDGEQPRTLEAWQSAIRGAPGSDVDVEVAYPCGGHKTVNITRDVVRIRY